MILCSNPKAQYLAHKAEIDVAISRVLEKGWYILGEEVLAFENELSAFIGVDHAIGVGNGTDALHLALRACDIRAGDEVITVSHTAVATVAAIELAGATPVLVDIEPDFYTLDPGQLQKAISSKTKAIILVHLYGQSADLEAVLKIAKQHNIRVIEDCAQAIGTLYKNRRVGSFGDLACFSFYPTKNLGAIGDGGMVVTNDRSLAKKVRELREYGWNESRLSQFAGVNSRLDELQAAVLRVKLRYLDENNAKRQNLAKLYNQGISRLLLPQIRSESTHVYHQYVVRCSQRNKLLSHLKADHCAAGVHYLVPVHLQPAYLRGQSKIHLPVTEQLVNEIISLPMYPELSNDNVQKVIQSIERFDQ
jgi:dTDP-4-amino-4,6-dideoxygalactose transaminase